MGKRGRSLLLVTFAGPRFRIPQMVSRGSLQSPSSCMSTLQKLQATLRYGVLYKLRQLEPVEILCH
jgi:hypothetical protein